MARKALWHGSALLLSLFAIGLMATFSSGSRDTERDIKARLDLAFEIPPPVEPAAAVRAEAWWKVRGRIFTALACILDPPPRIGCGGFPDMQPHFVAMAPIRSQSEEDEAALRMTHRLNGLWKAEGFALYIDGERAQANIDMNAPFQWERFLVKRIFDNTVVFSLGDELFRAQLSGEGVILTGTAFRGERILTAAR